MTRGRPRTSHACENRAFVDALIAAKTRELTSAELCERLDAAGIPNGLVNDMAAVLEHPAAVRTRPMDHDRLAGGRDRRGAAAGHELGVHAPSMGAIPALGEHTDAILAGIGRDEAAAPRGFATDGVVA